MSQKSPARQDSALQYGDKRQFCIYCHRHSYQTLNAPNDNMYCIRELCEGHINELLDQNYCSTLVTPGS